MKCKRPNCPNLAGGGRGLCRKHYRALKDKGYVDAGPSLARIAELRRLGYTVKRLSEVTGLSCNTICNLGKGPRGNVEVTTQAKIMAVPLPEQLHSCAVISSVGTVRRLRALMAIGYSQENIAEHLGTHKNVIGNWSTSKQVHSESAAKVAELFVKLEHTRGPSELAMQKAKKKGWVPPLGWDEDSIDDPDAEPYRPKKRDWRESRLCDQYHELATLGLTHEAITVRLGVRKKKAHDLRRYSIRKAS